MNILLIEDSRDLALNLFDYLQAKGHALDLASDGLSGLHLAACGPFDVIVLDWMLPGLDGLSVCRRLREAGRHTPVLLLTARDALNDKIAGLEAGADDYVVKPFAMRELEARLLALVRRSQLQDAAPVLQVGDLRLDPATLQVTRGGRDVELPPIPLRLLETLMRHAPRVMPREELERSLWGDSPPDSDALRAHLHVLRQAVDTPADKPLIRTVRGFGYQIRDA
jgi:DNA-binding response OmpR family regulator